MQSKMINWQSVAIIRQSTGINIVDIIFVIIFFFSFPLFPLLRLIEGVLESKDLFSKSWSNRWKIRSRTLSRPCGLFLAPLAAILAIAGVAAI